MSFDDPNGGQPRRGGDDDLMGVHGDVLFADPLGIRGKDKAGASAPAGGASRNAGDRLREPDRRNAPGRGRDDRRSEDMAEINSRALLEEAPPEDPGPLRTWFGYIFGGGTQCCGNRDRDKDAALAKKASATGRPPQSRQPFPEPGSKSSGAAPSNEPTNGRHRNMEPENVEDTRHVPRGAPPPRGDDPFATKHGAPPPRGGPPADLPDDAFGTGKSSNDPPSSASKRSPIDDTHMERLRAPEPERPPRAEDFTSSRPADSFAALEREKPPDGMLPRKWQWPDWTLNTKEALIEVYVSDEDSGEDRWCKAQPQFRVVDKEGLDAYLCAEYEWDGEYYVQDFGPHHVRKRGNTMTVFNLFSNDATEAEKFTESMTAGTRPVGRAPQKDDSGGGIGAFLKG